jgi:Glycosyltransferase family 87
VIGHAGSTSGRRLLWLSGITLLTVICVRGLLVIAPWEKLVPDFICYWAAGRIVASGHNPYDETLQTRFQRECGWDKATDGLGKFDFLPYYYPPWFAAFCGLLIPLGYEGAKIAWFALNLELLLLSGYLLRDAVPGLARLVPMVMVPVFILSVISLFVGQTSIPMLFLAAVAWRLLARGYDRPAGAALACLTTKPQVAAILVVALLLWAGRRRRWGVVQGFALTLAVLGLGSCLILPTWPIEMIRAGERTPPPTAHFPWIGTTWYLVLKTIGLRSWSLWLPYGAVVVPFLVLVARAALDRSRPLDDVMALGLLAPFIVAPYGRHYDFCVLLIPLFVLMGRRLSEVAGATLMVALMLLPYVHFGALMRFKDEYPSTVRLFPEFTFFWIPLLLTLIWLATELRAARGRRGDLVGADVVGASAL